MSLTYDICGNTCKLRTNIYTILIFLKYLLTQPGLKGSRTSRKQNLAHKQKKAGIANKFANKAYWYGAFNSFVYLLNYFFIYYVYNYDFSKLWLVNNKL